MFLSQTLYGQAASRGQEIGKKHHLNLWSRQTNNPMGIPYVALLLAGCRINVEFILSLPYGKKGEKHRMTTCKHHRRSASTPRPLGILESLNPLLQINWRRTMNIKRMDKKKHKKALEKLRNYLAK